MLTDKEVKSEFRKLSRDNPERFFAVNKLREFGFSRRTCKKCGRFFWSIEERDFCGDSTCVGGYGFIEKTPARKSFTYAGLWKRFSSMFKDFGYAPIKRYPVAARWRDDTDFVQASIYDFQPYVVSGMIEPPANPLVVPQFCLRFNDVDNVGLTGSHYTGFVMIGQHAFKKPSEFDQEKYFEDIHNWLVKGLKIPVKEIIYHEDAWAGGGNAGVCMEFFSRGLELGNQVYMSHQITNDGIEPLKLKVLDMGMGHERNTWFSQATPTSYDAVFPKVMKRLKEVSGESYDSSILKKFLPFASMLNVDENEDLNSVWSFISKKIGVNVNELKEMIYRIAALYSIAEHSRTLLFAFSDGCLPSNSGGGYNLRMILRRALSFIEKYKWSIDLKEVMELHAAELKEIFPEVSENLEDSIKILDVEKKKYRSSIEKSEVIIERFLNKGELSTEKFVELYDSNGISPDLIVRKALEKGIEIKIPDNFYALLNERHQSSKSIEKTQTFKEDAVNLKTEKKTEVLYYDDYSLVDFKARVLEIKKENNKFYVVLDKTAFYPTSGGQMHDFGFLNSNKVLDVFKQNNLVVHVLDSVDFKEGDIVIGKIDFEIRKQLTQHHTSTHIINGAARMVLGNHVWQAGASKTLERARLDITHYEQLSDKETKEIERLSNDIVKKAIAVKKYLMLRNEAEERFGFMIYQGGAVPGRELRIVEIPNFDVEACGGTHLNNTSEAEVIKIVKTSKIQDGIVRIEFVAGNAAMKIIKEQQELLRELCRILDCNKSEIPGRVEELFSLWKDIVKKNKKRMFKLSSKKIFEGSDDEIIKKSCDILKTQEEFLLKTINRFASEIKKSLKENKSLKQ
ncbi:MAG: alanine--tRNA ligase [Candidatus Woesearchaeota archaeon]